MGVVEARSPTARQLSALGADGGSILAVVAKRTYRLGQPCTLHDVQLSIREAPVVDPERAGLLIADLEVYPFKPLADIVVRGHAYSRGVRGVVRAEVTIGAHGRAIAVVGDRRAETTSGGEIAFSTPAPFERMPLEYDRAYGGRDVHAEQRFQNPFLPLVPYLPEGVDVEAYSPCIYPRNPHGRGYVLEATRQALEDCRLPNIEEPDDLLTPERLLVGHPRRWHTMPLPCGTTWVHPGAFSRMAYLGAFPFWQPLPERLQELERLYLPPEIRQLHLFRRDPLMMRFTNGASLGLQVPHTELHGTIAIRNLHPVSPHLEIALPREAPRIWVDGRKGRLTPTEPVIHHVEIEPDEDRLSIVWRGSAPALRPYYPEEIDAMPFRVEWSDR